MLWARMFHFLKRRVILPAWYRIAYSANAVAMILIASLTVGLGLAPLFGLAVPEATATLLGSFFGASIAVTWSLWAASKHRERADRELAHAIAIRLAPITTGLILIIELTRGNNPSPSDEAEFRSLSSELVQSVDDVVGDLIDLHQHLTGIGAANIAQLLELRRNLVQLRQLAQDILGTNVAFAALRSNGLLRHHDEISRAMDWLEVM